MNVAMMGGVSHVDPEAVGGFRAFRLQRAEATFEPLPMDAAVARAYGRVFAAVAGAGRKARGRRAVDLFIAATAVAAGLPFYTRHPDDFAGLSDLLETV